MSEEQSPSAEKTPDELDIGLGNAVFDDDGRKLGTIRGLEEDGFFVTFSEGMAELAGEHEKSFSGFGEAELMWRCTVCGEMGDIEAGLPDECPNCGSPKTDMEYWKED